MSKLTPARQNIACYFKSHTTRAGNFGSTKRKAPFKNINFSLYFSHKAYRAFSLARPAPLQIDWNKRIFKVENTTMINVTPSENAL